jgi:hypothetical protein
MALAGVEPAGGLGELALAHYDFHRGFTPTLSRASFAAASLTASRHSAR